MSFNYSCFISYRRHQGDDKFINKIKDLIESEAFKVTNKKNVFFDDKSINWGEDFDNKIYEGIVSSYFFIPLFHHVYLHEENLWCARELHWSIQLEEKIRKSISNYCFILPIIDRGSPSDFPDCLGSKNAKEIKKFRHLIISGGTSKAFEEFKAEIYDILLRNFNLLSKDISFFEHLNEVKPISDEELIAWVKKQKEKEKATSANNLPTLTYNKF